MYFANELPFCFLEQEIRITSDLLNFLKKVLKSRYGLDRYTPCIYCEKISHGESVVATLRNFRNHFQLSRHDPVPDPKTMMLRVKNFRATSSALNWKLPKRLRGV